MSLTDTDLHIVEFGVDVFKGNDAEDTRLPSA